MMNYRNQLSPWVIYQLLPNCQRLLVERFRRRSEAEAYLKALQRLQSQAEFTIVFELESPEKPFSEPFSLPHDQLPITDYQLPMTETTPIIPPASTRLVWDRECEEWVDH
jgi:hypothetical protein